MDLSCADGTGLTVNSLSPGLEVSHLRGQVKRSSQRVLPRLATSWGDVVGVGIKRSNSRIE